MSEARIHWFRGIAVTLVCLMVAPGIAAVLPILLLDVWDVPESLGGGALGRIVKAAVLTVGILLFLVLLYQSIGICERAFGRKHPDTGKLALKVGEGKGILQFIVIMVLTHFVVRSILVGLHTTTNWEFFEDQSGSLTIALTVGLLIALGNFQKTWVFVRRTDLEGHEDNQ